jgi:tocopherol O-methyltransferase
MAGLTATPSDVRAEVGQYYDGMWESYRRVWLDTDNLAFHFGYWDENTQSHSDSLLNMNRQLALRAHLRPGQLVLDAGCGVGGSSLWLAGQFPIQVVGIALGSGEIGRAREFAAERHLGDRVSFTQQDFLNTGFENETFDGVWSNESACHAVDKPAFLREAWRLLRPGGWLVMGDGFRRKRLYRQENEALMQQVFAHWRIPGLATQAEIVRWAKDAGFRRVRFEDIQSHVDRSHFRLYVLGTLAYRKDKQAHGLGLLSDGEYRRSLGAIAQWEAIERGLCFRGILSAQKPGG